ncbi:MAG: hypothetical protein PF489_02165 [Salinivirgaceae bacterium]|jgi:hypothetical protein|nr:hypothetical protein [Salinivirgaceae bacterium]
MESKTTEELFFYFKHDGSIDFPKKLAAGKLLYSRKFDRKLLAEEKRKIIENIHAEMKECESPDSIEQNYRKAVRKNVIVSLSIMTALAVVYAGWHFYRTGGTENMFTQLPYDALSVVVLPVWRYVWVNRLVVKKVRNAKRNYRLLQARLNTIETEWSF